MTIVEEIVGGGIEGFLLPIVELVVAVIIGTMIMAGSAIQNATNQIPNAPQTPVFNIGIVLVIFAIMNLIENFVTGFIGKPVYAISYCGGAILGLMTFNDVLIGIYPDLSGAVIGEIIIILIGMGLKIGLSIMRINSNSAESGGFLGDL